MMVSVCMSRVVAVTGSGEGPYPDLITLDEDGFLWRASASSSGEYAWARIKHPEIDRKDWDPK